MFGKAKARWLLVAALVAVLCYPVAAAEADRKVVYRVTPVYPELARHVNLAGTVKIEVVIAANGSVKSLRTIGGHPLFVQAATEALRRWRFAPGPETTTIVEFHFHDTDSAAPTAKEQP